MSEIGFVKMHGLGNDFVVLDARAGALGLDAAAARAIADRRTGVGCDQLLVIGPSRAADAFMTIYNHDGGRVAACGNGTRCVADLLMREAGRERLTIETDAGVLTAHAASDGAVAVDMGPALVGWREVPLAREADTLHVPVARGALRDPVCTSIGNPHATFFVDDAVAVELQALGPELEVDAMFPDRANIGVAQVVGPDRLRLRVWERGVGVTRACGSGACAAAVAAARRGLTGRRVAVELDGGGLDIEWRADGRVTMTGPVSYSFTGRLDIAALVGASAARAAAE